VAGEYGLEVYEREAVRCEMEDLRAKVRIKVVG
jgi:hypothetical protein